MCRLACYRINFQPCLQAVFSYTVCVQADSKYNSQRSNPRHSTEQHITTKTKQKGSAVHWERFHERRKEVKYSL